MTTTERLAKGTPVEFKLMQLPMKGVIDSYSEFSGHYRIEYTELDINGEPETHYQNREREQFIVLEDDLSRFKLYDAPCGPEVATEHDTCVCGVSMMTCAIGSDLCLQPAMQDAPAIDIPVTLPQPLQRLEELEAENAELKFTLECANTVTNGYQKDACDLRERVEALEAENARLKAALQPFATHWYNVLRRYPYHADSYVSGARDEDELRGIMAGELRCAAEALKASAA